MRSEVALGVGLSLALLALPAEGASPADQAAADALFTEGKRLAAAGDYEHACPKLAESNRLDPGAGTLLNLGNCYERLGKLASAWATFNEADSTGRRAGDTARAAEGARRAQEIAPRLPKLTITVQPAARIPGLELRRDGSLVGEAQWGIPVPVDPGAHEIEATAPGRAPWRGHVTATSGSTSVAVPVLVEESGGSSGSAGTATTPWTSKRVAGAAIAGGGVAGLVVGAVLGALALQKNSASKADCSPSNSNLCTSAGVSSRESAIHLGNGSTAALAVGGAFVATGVVLFAAGSSPQIQVAPSAGSIAVRGTF